MKVDDSVTLEPGGPQTIKGLSVAEYHREYMRARRAKATLLRTPGSSAPQSAAERKRRQRARKAVAAIGIDPAALNFHTSTRYKHELALAVKNTIEVELVPLAVKVIRIILTDAAVSPRDRLQAARIVLNRGGFPERPHVESSDDKRIEEMSRDELHDFVRAAEVKLSDMATLVSAAPDEDEEA